MTENTTPDNTNLLIFFNLLHGIVPMQLYALTTGTLKALISAALRLPKERIIVRFLTEIDGGGKYTIEQQHDGIGTIPHGINPQVLSIALHAVVNEINNYSHETGPQHNPRTSPDHLAIELLEYFKTRILDYGTTAPIDALFTANPTYFHKRLPAMAAEDATNAVQRAFARVAPFLNVRITLDQRHPPDKLSLSYVGAESDTDSVYNLFFTALESVQRQHAE